MGEFRADLPVDDRLIAEVKTVGRRIAAHEVQLVDDLKATGLRVGLSMNFGPHPEFERRVFGPTSLDPPQSALVRVKKNDV